MDDEDLDLSAQLSAWTAPPAPHNLADRVIARATATEEAIAVVTQRRRTQRRWWIGGALAAMIVGVAIAVFIVYEGPAKPTSAGQSVVVQPGTIYDVVPGQPPVVNRDVVTRTIGGAPVTDRTAARPAQDHGLTAADFDIVMKLLAPTLAPCVKKWPSGQDVAVSVAADGHVTDILTTDSDRNADACLRKVLRNAAFPKTKVSSRLTYHVEAPCNAEDLMNAGIQATARGDTAVALQSFEASLACKYDVHALTLAFMAGCRANDVNAARRFWKRMNPEQKTHFVQMCVHEHITQQQLDE